ncbi:hypothetical protein BKA62DRAFT_704994 [Auriculariales sp. MPI-PUGE-AT-0066]|nr:hypothetical protein BKA62DRAFT_704994 [Auriculariales sp. MPI-PUGE-AT-0066]
MTCKPRRLASVFSFLALSRLLIEARFRLMMVSPSITVNQFIFNVHADRDVAHLPTTALCPVREALLLSGALKNESPTTLPQKLLVQLLRDLEGGSSCNHDYAPNASRGHTASGDELARNELAEVSASLESLSIADNGHWMDCPEVQKHVDQLVQCQMAKRNTPEAGASTNSSFNKSQPPSAAPSSQTQILVPDSDTEAEPAALAPILTKESLRQPLSSASCRSLPTKRLELHPRPVVFKPQKLAKKRGPLKWSGPGFDGRSRVPRGGDSKPQRVVPVQRPHVEEHDLFGEPKSHSGKRPIPQESSSSESDSDETDSEREAFIRRALMHSTSAPTTSSLFKSPTSFANMDSASHEPPSVTRDVPQSANIKRQRPHRRKKKNKSRDSVILHEIGQLSITHGESSLEPGHPSTEELHHIHPHPPAQEKRLASGDDDKIEDPAPAAKRRKQSFTIIRPQATSLMDERLERPGIPIITPSTIEVARRKADAARAAEIKIARRMKQIRLAESRNRRRAMFN